MTKAIGIASTSVPILGAIVASMFWVDARYAHAEDMYRSMAQQNLMTQEALIELRLEQNIFQSRSAARRLQQGSITPELDREELEDLKGNRILLRERLGNVRNQLRGIK